MTKSENTDKMSDACHKVKESIFITKNGYGDLVVMSIETYEQVAFKKYKRISLCFSFQRFVAKQNQETNQ
jgi:PHD/YefM family antitoxin component YafN of YafNO toxin-antitoxin module